MAKRNHERRSPDDRIKELEEKIAALKVRLERKQRKDGPVVKEFKKVQRILRHFAQTAHQHSRGDIGNMVEAFTAGLERQVDLQPEEPRRRGRSFSAAEA